MGRVSDKDVTPVGVKMAAGEARAGPIWRGGFGPLSTPSSGRKPFIPPSGGINYTEKGNLGYRKYTRA